MSKLDELKKSILANGVIDKDEIAELRKVLFADGIIDKEEAEFVFELNDAVSGKNNDASWQTLFVDAISSYLLEDEISPGEIDDEEANWLLAKIQGDGNLDATEKALLANLKAKAKNFPAMLNL
ncbi:MAG: TerB family tellurite resistance protein [Prevotellaceae bacterium]|jgi:hypothetical protein|nr:TerB family tellurite resistance protein [Prevotellaceae bacterium]